MPCRPGMLKMTRRIKKPTLHMAASAALLISLYCIETGSATAGVHVDAKSFRCITKMTKVRQFYVDNLLGNLDGTLAVAHSATGGVYPVGSVIQLIPGEAMIKRDKGFNPATNDWEFFELDLSKNGTEIRRRGFAEVVNRFGGNCFGCHVQAHPEFDLICEMGHGCAPIPVTRAMIGALQRTDPRCKTLSVSAEDAKALKDLDLLLKPASPSTGMR